MTLVGWSFAWFCAWNWSNGSPGYCSQNAAPTDHVRSCSICKARDHIALDSQEVAEVDSTPGSHVYCTKTAFWGGLPCCSANPVKQPGKGRNGGYRMHDGGCAWTG